MIDTTIASSFDVNFSMDILLQQAIKHLGIQTADVVIFNPDTLNFQFSSKLGIPPTIREMFDLRLDNCFAGQVFHGRKSVVHEDLTHNIGGLNREVEMLRSGYKSYIGVPIIAKGMVKGVLEFYHQKHFSPDQEQHGFMESLAGQAAIAIDNAQLFEKIQGTNSELRLAYDETIRGWSQAMDLRDKETEGHSQRVTEMTMEIAQIMGSSKDELFHIRRGALLHDIGKLGVPDEILRKAGPLSEEEWKIMKQHPQLAYEMLLPISYLSPALDIPRCHHEKWDGTGYPRGLTGEQIPLAARIFSVVDNWDALTSDRPYRKAWTKKATLDYIKEQSGKHFDPRVVEFFVNKYGK
jgi:response regulator RpfG family c-di-GMP phosphodiesterase